MYIQLKNNSAIKFISCIFLVRALIRNTHQSVTKYIDVYSIKNNNSAIKFMLLIDKLININVSFIMTSRNKDMLSYVIYNSIL